MHLTLLSTALLLAPLALAGPLRASDNSNTMQARDTQPVDPSNTDGTLPISTVFTPEGFCTASLYFHSSGAADGSGCYSASYECNTRLSASCHVAPVVTLFEKGSASHVISSHEFQVQNLGAPGGKQEHDYRRDQDWVCTGNAVDLAIYVEDSIPC